MTTATHGAGLIVIWNDIVPESRDNFLAWHSREHIPERVAIPGFLRGQRWFGESSAPQYLTIYATSDASVLTSPAYIERLNNPTPWTRQSVADFRNTSRAAGSLLWQSSDASGGAILSARFDLTTSRAHALADTWSQGLLHALAQQPGVARVRLIASAVSASQLQTAERAVRSGDLREPPLILLIEGFGDEKCLHSAYASAAQTEPEFANARVDFYQLQFDLIAQHRSL